MSQSTKSKVITSYPLRVDNGKVVSRLGCIAIRKHETLQSLGVK